MHTVTAPIIDVVPADRASRASVASSPVRATVPLCADRLVSEFLAAWNCVGGAARRRHLDATWNEHGVFTDPIVCARGRDELDAYIAGARGVDPGLRFIVAGSIAQHHSSLRFCWSAVDARGHEKLAGCSYGDVDGRGRLRHLTVFFAGGPVLRAPLGAAFGSLCPRPDARP